MSVDRRPPRRPRRRLPRRVRVVLAVLCAGGALLGVMGSGSPEDDPSALAQAQAPPGGGERAGLVRRGRNLFVDGCSTCHGTDARGIHGRGPSLVGVGEQSADFYLGTGRMPLDHPGSQPLRGQLAYSDADTRALVAYVGSLGGPPIPRVDPARGELNEGFVLFRDRCAGCHQIVAQGGNITGARVPDLKDSTPTQIGEAVRIGPFLMPTFSEREITKSELDSLARYIAYTRHPEDRGGWGLGHIGPIPEGLVTLFLGLAALLLVTRLIGERTTR